MSEEMTNVQKLREDLKTVAQACVDDALTCDLELHFNYKRVLDAKPSDLFEHIKARAIRLSTSDEDIGLTGDAIAKAEEIMNGGAVPA